MAPDIPVAALIHISDLHFGSIFHNREHWFHRIAAKTPFQGLFPHDCQIAQALSHVINNLAQKYSVKNTPVVVIHSGDLTRAGKNAEFSVGSTFLHSHFDEAGYCVGLRMKRSSERSMACVDPAVFDVPGNHDLWDRKHPDSVFRDHYPGPYPMEFRMQLNSKATLVIYGLDSNRSKLREHRKAKGEIDSRQLERICSHLQKDAEERHSIRVVALHHPLYDPEGASSATSRLRLNHRENVARRLREAGAHLVLSGHVHVPAFFPTTGDRPAHLIAGSGCQMGSQCSINAIELVDQGAKSIRYDYDPQKLQFCASVETPIKY